jgi:hypothetical protein
MLIEDVIFLSLLLGLILGLSCFNDGSSLLTRIEDDGKFLRLYYYVERLDMCEAENYIYIYIYIYMCVSILLLHKISYGISG